jgi:hypothetical protein
MMNQKLLNKKRLKNLRKLKLKRRLLWLNLLKLLKPNPPQTAFTILVI